MIGGAADFPRGLGVLALGQQHGGKPEARANARRVELDGAQVRLLRGGEALQAEQRLGEQHVRHRLVGNRLGERVEHACGVAVQPGTLVERRAEHVDGGRRPGADGERAQRDRHRLVDRLLLEVQVAGQRERLGVVGRPRRGSGG